jgi:hypothetical protein
MGSKYLTLTVDRQEYGYELALKLAREQLAGFDDIAQQCLKTDAQYKPSKQAIKLDYLNRTYLIALPNGEVSLVTGKEEVPLREKILILHYFIQAKGTPLSNQMITYKELREGINYFPIFYKRAIRPLVNYFGSEPQRLADIAESLGGRKADFGDAATTIKAFSRVPITLVLWKGDEEFAPEGSIMFDSTVSNYLTNDDIHALCETIAWRLVRLLKAGGDNPGKSRR